MSEVIVMSNVKVYVGCALRDIPDNEREDFLREVDLIREDIREAGFDVVEFIGLGNHEAGYVYGEDINRMRTSDVVVAVCDYPSTGLGIEIGKAIGFQKPILAISKRVDISKMITGAPKHEVMMRYCCYQEREEIITALRGMVQIFFR